MKKRGCLGIIITIALVFLLIAGGVFGYLFFKVKGTADHIHKPIDGREKSELRDKKVSINNQDAISVALFGVDSNQTRLAEGDHGRTDTIVLLNMNPKKKTAVMVSIPRDTYSEIVGKNVHEKINHAYAYGGPMMAVLSVEKLMNVPIDYYASINMDGMKQLIDKVGGVDVVSNGTFIAGDMSFQKGQKVHLDGEQALKFIRSRKEDGSGGDFGRQERQQLVIEALAGKVLSFGSVTKIDSILKTVEDNVVTDMTFDDLTGLRKGYGSTLNHVKKYQLQGDGQILDDGLWYFMPDKQQKKEITDLYNENLK